VDLRDQPEVQGDLWFTLGSTFSEIKDHRRAAALFERAVDNYRVAPGGDNTGLALALANRGRCQSFIGNVAAGKTNARLGLEMARRCGDPQVLGECLQLMGHACDFYGFNFADAEPYYREAIELQRNLGNNPVALADGLRSLSDCLLMEYEESVPLVREALTLHRQHLGPEHPKVASDLDGLGQVLFLHGDAAKAEQVLREAIDLYRKIYDSRFPYHRTTRRTLAEAIVLQQKWAEAEAVARDVPYALDGVDWDLLGRINAYRGRWSEAAEQFARAVEYDPELDKYRLAVALVTTKQGETYRKLRHEFLANYRSDSPDGARALAFLLQPVDHEERTRLREQLDSFDRTSMGPLNASRGRLDKALAAYRLGQLQVALEVASPAVVDGARRPNPAQHGSFRRWR
jgi:tetratricopeptide (TPR) repeat protein